MAEALEKKPKMLFCFPADDDDMAVAFLAVDGVLAGVCRGFSDWLTMAAGATAQLAGKRQQRDYRQRSTRHEWEHC